MGRKNKKNSWKNREGVVYSTSDSYEYQESGESDEETLAPSEQRLLLRMEKRKGKPVTLVEGFHGSADDLKSLGKDLKNHCGVGGTAKDGIILLQGDFRDKIRAFLDSIGYRVR